MSKLKMKKINASSALIREQCGSLGDLITYSKTSENKILRISESKSFSNSVRQSFGNIFREVFLPHGYPDSVSEDYFNYQIWDTLQAFCSTITGTFTTQAVLKGVGVGNAEASPLAAAITWVLKDGTGMLGRIIFAWWKGNNLDTDCKKWRLFADIVNDLAMCTELTVPYFTDFSLQLLCITTTMKAVVGVAGGATRASITQHQAIKGNMADVSAKDGSQETCVNLIASVVGIVLLAVFSGGQYDWTIFLLFATMHLIANYFAVNSLIFKHLNIGRILLVMKMYLKFDTVASPTSINKGESVILGFGMNAKSLCGYKIKMGHSLKKTLATLTSDELTDVLAVYQEKSYFIVPNFKNKTLYVAFQHNESPEVVITAYFHAIMIGIALCKYNDEPMRHLHQITPLIRLNTIMKSFPKNSTRQLRYLPRASHEMFNEYINFEVNNFFTALKVNGWSTTTHAIEIGSWRYIDNDKLSLRNTSTKED